MAKEHPSSSPVVCVLSIGINFLDHNKHNPTPPSTILFKVAATRYRCNNSKRERNYVLTITSSTILSSLYKVVCNLFRKHFREPPTIFVTSPKYQTSFLSQVLFLMNWGTILTSASSSTETHNRF